MKQEIKENYAIWDKINQRVRLIEDLADWYISLPNDWHEDFSSRKELMQLCERACEITNK